MPSKAIVVGGVITFGFCAFNHASTPGTCFSVNPSPFRHTNIRKINSSSRHPARIPCGPMKIFSIPERERCAAGRNSSAAAGTPLVSPLVVIAPLPTGFSSPQPPRLPRPRSKYFGFGRLDGSEKLQVALQTGGLVWEEIGFSAGPDDRCGQNQYPSLLATPGHLTALSNLCTSTLRFGGHRNLDVRALLQLHLLAMRIRQRIFHAQLAIPASGVLHRDLRLSRPARAPRRNHLVHRSRHGRARVFQNSCRVQNPLHFSGGLAYRRLRHFRLDARSRCTARSSSSSLMTHTPILTAKPKPHSPISHTYAIYADSVYLEASLPQILTAPPETSFPAHAPLAENNAENCKSAATTWPDQCSSHQRSDRARRARGRSLLPPPDPRPVASISHPPSDAS